MNVQAPLWALRGRLSQPSLPTTPRRRQIRAILRNEAKLCCDVSKNRRKLLVVNMMHTLQKNDKWLRFPGMRGLVENLAVSSLI